MGLSDEVDFIMTDDRPNLFFLQGFHRLDERGRHFVVRAAVVSSVSEGALAVLMHDPRVATIYPQLWQTLAEHMSALVQQPDSTWQALAV
eukprot:1241245-Lingulodinium_polyedra.AAC.1